MDTFLRCLLGLVATALIFLVIAGALYLGFGDWEPVWKWIKIILIVNVALSLILSISVVYAYIEYKWWIWW